MQNFHSKTLERDFEVVYFVGAITVAGNDQGPSQMAQTSFMHPPKSGKGSKSQTEVSGIKRAKDGKNVAEIIAGRKDLARLWERTGSTCRMAAAAKGPMI
jgi:hypothetical protein